MEIHSLSSPIVQFQVKFSGYISLPQVCVRILMFIDCHNKIELYDKTVINYSDILISMI
jgi:hypothetical protein